MRVYIAAPFFNEVQLGRVVRFEEILKNHNIDYFSPRSFGVIKDMTQEEKDRRMKEIYEKNIEQLDSCDVVVVFVDVPDTGTIFELGYSASNKSLYEIRGFNPLRIVTFSENGKPVNVMLRYCLDAHVNSFEDLSALMFDLSRYDIVDEKFRCFPEVNE